MTAKNKSKKVQKAFFFLRHNNDIDHITPAIHKFVNNEKIPVDVIITTDKKYLTDSRIEMLKEFKNVKVYHVSDLFDSLLLRLSRNDIFLFFSRLKRFSKYSFLKNRVEKIYSEYEKKLFEDVDSAVVVFDWKTSFFVKKTVELAKKRGFTTASLPHGDAPYASSMELADDIYYSCKFANKESEIFDYVVVPNYLCYDRYKGHLPEDRIKTLGSPRYCDEWSNIITEHIPTFKLEGDEGKLKILLVLRTISYPIFWEELVRSIKMILSFPDVYLIIKHHPRDAKSQIFTKKILELYPELMKNINKNMKFIYSEVSSSSLIKWSDLIIDLGTSATWEAIREKKPVLMIEYLYPSYSTIAHYMKSSEILSRDELYDTIDSFVKNKNQKFYDEKERMNFMKEIIHTPDENVLDRYSSFIKKCLDESSKK